jgi:hypothetical protein
MGTPSLVGRFGPAVLARLANAPVRHAPMSRFLIVLHRDKPGLHPRRPAFFVGNFYPCPLLIVGAASASPGRARMSRFPAGTGAT